MCDKVCWYGFLIWFKREYATVYCIIVQIGIAYWIYKLKNKRTTLADCPHIN